MSEQVHGAESDAACRHCGSPPESDGDHSCPCPYRDDDCPDHPLVVSPIIATPWPEDEPLGSPPPWPTCAEDLRARADREADR